MPPLTSSRKQEHLAVCIHKQVEATRTTLLEEVELVHQGLPERSFYEVDTRVEWFGRRLKAPLLISGMTGGTPQAERLNRQLAEVAARLGIAMGLGSQRSMLDDPSSALSYDVRPEAPDIVLIANLGAVQAVRASRGVLDRLVDVVGADALAIHLNPAQELRQPEGDRDFVGLTEGIARIKEEVGVPLIVKETGCGLSRETLARIAGTGVEWVDTAGRGGTSWPQVESLRSPTFYPEEAELFRNWGIPTAASVGYAVEMGFHTIASGGIRDGMDVATSLAMGASLVGMALPWIKAVDRGGVELAVEFGESVIHALKVAMLLTGSSTIEELRAVPKVLGPNLKAWLAA